MAVVIRKSPLFRDAQTLAAELDPLQLKGVVRRAGTRAENLSTDNTGSKYKLITLPSYVVLGPGTTFHVENWGFAAIRIGTFTQADALVSVLKSAATFQAPISAQAATAWQPLWSRLGLAADPNEPIDIWAHAIADATAAGHMPFTFEWIDRG